METSFKRENRYLVLRWSDINEYLSPSWQSDLECIVHIVGTGRLKDGKDPNPKFVCIKDTYPEYEMVWKAIEERMKNE